MSILGQAGSGLQCRTCLPADRIATLVHTYDCELKLVGSLTGYRKTYGDAEAVGIDGLGHEYRRARRLAQQKGFGVIGQPRVDAGQLTPVIGKAILPQQVREGREA